MIRQLERSFVSNEVTNFTFSGNSNDTKPTGDYIATGSVFIEVDTGKAYFYDEDEETWYEAGGGSGGGSDGGGVDPDFPPMNAE